MTVEANNSIHMTQCSRSSHRDEQLSLDPSWHTSPILKSKKCPVALGNQCGGSHKPGHTTAGGWAAGTVIETAFDKHNKTMHCHK